MSLSDSTLHGFLDEFDQLVKQGGSRWVKYVRSMAGKNPAEVGTAMSKMMRLSGKAPGTLIKDWSAGKPVAQENLERMVKGIRGRMSSGLPEFAPRGSQAWRDAMLDIKHGRMVPLESGLSTEQAKSIQQFGPSSNISGGHWGAGTEGEGKMLPSLENWMSRWKAPGDEEKFFKNYDRANTGIWTAAQGTPRSWEYAERAARTGGKPAVMQFQVPQSLAQIERGKELVIPRAIFGPWARNIKVVER